MKQQPLERFSSAAKFESWLEANHSASEGLWLELAKKGATFSTLSYSEAVEIALCWGWIDGQKGAVGASSWKQRFTPRRAKSVWSKINRDKVGRLLAEGRMREPGLEQVRLAKEDGRWDAAYDSPKTATAPDDLLAALERSAPAKEFFAKLDASNRYAIYFRVTTAKRPETRAKRIDQFVKDLSKGAVPYPDRLPKELRRSRGK